MTDNEIIKALEQLAKSNMGGVWIIDKALDLINRQKAENSELVGKIDKLQAEIEKYENIKTTIDEFWDILLKIKMAKRKEKPTLEELAEAIEKIETEAIKEFAERLKTEAFECDVSFGYGKECYQQAVAVIEIDNLVKEMTE